MPASHSPARKLRPSSLLVAGYRGTLRAAEDQKDRGPEGGRPQNTAGELMPPALEHMLDQWTKEGAAKLLRRAPAALLIFAGEAIPLDGLVLNLRDRLLGLLLQSIDGIGEHEFPEGQLEKLPALLRLLRTTMEDWVHASLTFLERWSRDHRELARAQECVQLPPIASVSGCASDVHAGGHSVLRVKFIGGQAIYYKPRPVTGEWLWERLLEALTETDRTLYLPAARVLQTIKNLRYGWLESLVAEERPTAASSCHESHNARDYWQSAGAMLLLAQHVRLTDLHLANVMATPAGPAVLDAECLGTLGPAVRLQPRTSKRSGQAFEQAFDSLLATGLLPRAAEPGSPEISGLLGRGGPAGEVLLPRWRHVEDGSYRLEPIPAELVEHANTPEATSAAAILPQLANGYRHAAEVLLAARKRLMEPGSAWRKVLERQHAPRIVVRPTLAYAGWISRSLHPDYLHSPALRRSAVFATVQAEAANSPLSPALVRAESNAILRAHVPRFVVLPRSRTLAETSGKALVYSFTSATAPEAIYPAIDQLSPDHLKHMLLPALFAACLRPS